MKKKKDVIVVEAEILPTDNAEAAAEELKLAVDIVVNTDIQPDDIDAELRRFAKNKDEAQWNLAFLLKRAREFNIHLSLGAADFYAYATEITGWFKPKIDILINMWNMLEDLGIQKMLQHYSVSKLQEVVPLWDRRLVTKSSDEPVEWARLDSGMSLKEIKRIINQKLVGDPKTGDDAVAPDKPVTMRFNIPDCQTDSFQTALHSMKDVIGNREGRPAAEIKDGEVIYEAVTNQSTLNLDEDEVEAAKTMTLTNMARIVEEQHPTLKIAFLPSFPQMFQFFRGNKWEFAITETQAQAEKLLGTPVQKVSGKLSFYNPESNVFSTISLLGDKSSKTTVVDAAKEPAEAPKRGRKPKVRPEAEEEEPAEELVKEPAEKPAEKPKKGKKKKIEDNFLELLFKETTETLGNLANKISNWMVKEQAIITSAVYKEAFNRIQSEFPSDSQMQVGALITWLLDIMKDEADSCDPDRFNTLVTELQDIFKSEGITWMGNKR